MPKDPSGEMLKDYIRELGLRQPSRKEDLRPCLYDFHHTTVLSFGITNKENTGRRFEICCPPNKDHSHCLFHKRPATSQLTCGDLVDLYAYAASLDPPPWGDEAFVQFACSSAIALNHRAAQAQVNPPNRYEAHMLPFQRVFPPYVDLPTYSPIDLAMDAPLIVTPSSFAGLLTCPQLRRTGLLPPGEHRVKVPVHIFQINDFPATLIECVGIKRDLIIEFCLRQSAVFKELRLPVTDRRVLASLQIYLPAQARWTRAPRPSDVLRLALNEGVIYRYSDVSRTPSLHQVVQQVIPRYLLGGGVPLPGLLAYQQQLEQPQVVASASASASSAVRAPTAPALFRKAHRKNRSVVLAPVPTGRRPRRETGVSGTSASGHNLASRGAPRHLPDAGNYTQAATDNSEVIDLSNDVDDHGEGGNGAKGAMDTSEVIDISDDVHDHADFVNRTARFWQVRLKTGSASLCLRAKGTESDPIDLVYIGSELEDRGQIAL